MLDYKNPEGYADPTPYHALADKGKYRPMVYICSAYSGDVENNVRCARDYCRMAVDQGAIPIAPHLLFPQFMSEETERELAMFMDIAVLSHCKELWVFGEPTAGMQKEIAYAERKQMTIKYFNKEGFTMKEFWNTIQLIFTAIGGWLGYFLGGCDGLLYALIAFVVVDYITGVMCAAADKKLSSEVGFKGIEKKVLVFLLVGIANILDVQVIGTGSVLRTAVIFFYISNEGVSLLENAGHLGLPIPEKLKDILAQLHDKAEKGDE